MWPGHAHPGSPRCRQSRNRHWPAIARISGNASATSAGVERGQEEGPAPPPCRRSAPPSCERDETRIARGVAPRAVAVADVADRALDAGQAAGERRLADAGLADERGHPPVDQRRATSATNAGSFAEPDEHRVPERPVQAGQRLTVRSDLRADPPSSGRAPRRARPTQAATRYRSIRCGRGSGRVSDSTTRRMSAFATTTRRGPSGPAARSRLVARGRIAGDHEVVAGGAQLDPVAHDERPAGKPGQRSAPHARSSPISTVAVGPETRGTRDGSAEDTPTDAIPGVMSGTSTVAGHQRSQRLRRPGRAPGTCRSDRRSPA